MAKKKEVVEIGANYELSDEEKEGIAIVHDNYREAVNSVVDSDQYAREFLVAIKSSENQEITQISRTETKKYDTIWIDNFENAITAFENIAKDPKKHIRLERYITPIELARKITSESVIHLSSHSQYVKDIDKNGNIIPNKILTVSAEDEYGIYENRFVKTCADRALNFINKRYDYITKHADTRDSDVIVMKNTVMIGDVKYEYESKVKISVPSSDEGYKEENDRLFKKIELIRRRLMYFSQGWFMEELKDAKPVTGAIMQTNIIVKNPNYKKVHLLWKFLERYDKLGISIHVKEVNAKFDQLYIDELQKNMFGSIISLRTNKTRMIDLAKVKAYRVTPHIGNKVIDKDFLDSKFDIEGHYYGSQTITPKMKALRKKQEMQRKAKMRALELKKIEREKAREVAKRREEERIAKMRADQAAAEERARIAAEKAEARRKEEERIAQARAREKAILDAERDALIRAREASRRIAEEDRKKELKVLHPSGLSPEQEEEIELRDFADEIMAQVEQERIRKMELIKSREEARKKALESKLAARKAATEARLKHHRDLVLEDEEQKKNKLRDALMAQAQERLAALRAANEALRRAQLEEERAFEEEEDDDDFTFSDDAVSSQDRADIFEDEDESAKEAPAQDDEFLEEEEDFEDYDDEDDFDTLTTEEYYEAEQEANEEIERIESAQAAAEESSDDETSLEEVSEDDENADYSDFELDESSSIIPDEEIDAVSDMDFGSDDKKSDDSDDLLDSDNGFI